MKLTKERFSNGIYSEEEFWYTIQVTKEEKEQILENEQDNKNLKAGRNILLEEIKLLKEEILYNKKEYRELEIKHHDLKQKLGEIEEAYLNIHFSDDGEVFQYKIKKILDSQEK